MHRVRRGNCGEGRSADGAESREVGGADGASEGALTRRETRQRRGGEKRVVSVL